MGEEGGGAGRWLLIKHSMRLFFSSSGVRTLKNDEALSWVDENVMKLFLCRVDFFLSDNLLVDENRGGTVHCVAWETRALDFAVVVMIP